MLVGTAGYRWVLEGTIGYWWVVLGTGGSWWVLVGTSGYWWVLAGTGRYRWVLVGTGGYWWVLAMLWDVFEAHVVGRAWWIDNACGTGALIGALIRPVDLVSLEGLRTLS